MLLKRRTSRIDNGPSEVRPGFEHLDQGALAVLRWLADNRIQFVLVGPVADAVRGRAPVDGPVSIVPAPHRRNLERLAQSLDDLHATIRIDAAGVDGEADTTPTRLTGEKLGRGQRWTLRIGSHDLDIEGRVPGITTYQELLYETSRFEPAEGIAVEVASPVDIEQYAHVRLTGVLPEMQLSRKVAVGQDLT